MAASTRTKKRIIRAFIAIAIALIGFAMILGVLFLAEKWISSGDRPTVDDLNEPDYSEDIFEDAAYLRLNRSVFYTEYGSGEELTEENCDRVGLASAFFYDYFDAIIRGDAAGYHQMLSERFLRENDVPDRFTMQKLYDIKVNQCQDVHQTTYQGMSAEVYYFEVQYKIYQNNGTFRDDIGSNRSVTQYYELYRIGDTFLLNGITTKQVVRK